MLARCSLAGPIQRRSHVLPICWAAAVVSALLAACTFDTRPDFSIDAAPIDASIDAPVVPAHLLLSEVKTSNSQGLREFIELFNPTPTAIDLRDYYLADDAAYARLPAIVAGEMATIEDGDFIGRFPQGATIEPGAVLVVAIRTTVSRPFVGSSFAVRAGDNTPPLEPAFPGSISTFPELSNDEGEGIALFRWNGQSDLVTDVDLLGAGFAIAPDNALPNKSGLAIDGPDENAEVSTYATDAFTMPMFPRANGLNEAFVRVELEQGETRENGNGVDGHDETSEVVTSSWSIAPETPGTTSLAP